MVHPTWNKYQIAPDAPAAADAPAAQTMTRERESSAPIAETNDEAASWAAGWWAALSKEHRDTRELTSSAALLEKLAPAADGGLAPVRLLRGTWLMQRAEKLRRARNDAERERRALRGSKKREPGVLQEERDKALAKVVERGETAVATAEGTLMAKTREYDKVTASAASEAEVSKAEAEAKTAVAVKKRAEQMAKATAEMEAAKWAALIEQSEAAAASIVEKTAAADELALPRRQELPEEAFLGAEEVGALRGHGESDGCACYACGVPKFCGCGRPPEERPLRLLAASYGPAPDTRTRVAFAARLSLLAWCERALASRAGWLTPSHPDPRGQQLVAFADVVDREQGRCCRADESFGFGGAQCLFTCCTGFLPYGVCCGVPCCGQQCCKAAFHFPRGEFAVFWDWASVPQEDADGERTAEEAAAFAEAQRTVSTWYGHAQTTVVSLDATPAGWVTGWETGWENVDDGSERAELDERGWPTFESMVGGLTKQPSVYAWPRHMWAELECRSQLRAPPHHPQTFAATLARKSWQGGRSDCELVATRYAEALDSALSAETLTFGAGWGDEEAARLAEALPLARNATELNIKGNYRIGERGYEALAAAIRAGAMPRLKTLKFHVGERASLPLRKICVVRDIEIGLELPPSIVAAWKAEGT